MPSLFFYPSPVLYFMLSLSLLSWQRTRSKDIHHLLIQTEAKTFALQHSSCLIVGFRSSNPVLLSCRRILRNRFRTAQLDGITRSVRVRKQINRLHFMPQIWPLLYTVDASQSKHNESIMKSALTMESGHCCLIYIDLFVGFVECVCMFDGNCLESLSQISSSFLLPPPSVLTGLRWSNGLSAWLCWCSAGSLCYGPPQN